MLAESQAWSGQALPDDELLAEVDRFLATGGIRVRGPLNLQRDTSLAESLTSFRAQGYSRKLPHILSDGVRQLDEALRLDARALHFLAHDCRSTRGSVHPISGAVRLIARPYEFELLCPALEEQAEHRPRHLEISRLLVNGGPSNARLTARLLLAMGRWAWGQGTWSGFWALCSGSRARVFRRFGMKVTLDGIAVPERPGRHYSLLEADFAALAAAARTQLPSWLSRGAR